MSSPVESASSTSRVVIADDNDGVRVLLRTLIEIDGRLRLVGEATDGRQALELVEAEQPDILLLDLSMPGLDGLQVLTELRRRQPTPRVLVYSGFSGPDIREAALRAGADDFLLKGVEPSEIVDRLARLASSPTRSHASRFSACWLSDSCCSCFTRPASGHLIAAAGISAVACGALAYGKWFEVNSVAAVLRLWPSSSRSPSCARARAEASPDSARFSSCPSCGSRSTERDRRSESCWSPY